MIKPNITLQDIDDEIIEDFKKIETNENSDLECVIIYKGRRVSFNKTSLWKSKSVAKSAITFNIKNYIKYNNCFWSFVFDSNCTFNSHLIPKEWVDHANETCERIAKEFDIVLLRDYMHAEYMANKEKNNET